MGFRKFFLGFKHKITDLQSILTPLWSRLYLIQEILEFFILDVVVVTLILFDSFPLNDQEGVIFPRGRGQHQLILETDLDLVI